MARALLLLLLLPTGAHASEPPAGLACLGRYYAVTPILEGGAWWMTLPDGARLPWDDGRVKSLDERLESPDGKDLFAIPYRTGPLRAVDDPADDPGRSRIATLFAATFPASARVSVDFVGHHVRFAGRAAAALGRVSARLEKAIASDPTLVKYLTHLGGTIAERRIAGTDRPSAHSYGIAIDIDTDHSDYWRWQRGARRWRNRIPAAIVDAFEAEGFIWGGRWYHFDTMHFEYRPELLDEKCRAKEGTSGAAK